MSAKVNISDLAYKVEFCDWEEIEKENGYTEHLRSPLFETWAKITPMNPYKISSFKVALEDRSKITHSILIRKRCDFSIGPRNWVYYKDTPHNEESWYRVWSRKDFKDGYNDYSEFACSLWSKDFDNLDSLTQDVPSESLEPSPSYDLRDLQYW